MIETDRLLLRDWREEDLPSLLAICSDPRVMATIGPLQNEVEVRAAITRQQEHQKAHGYCYWAMELRAEAAVIGFCGLEFQDIAMPIAGLTDIGWRLAHRRWGQGYAREAAEASLAWAWSMTCLSQVVAITTAANTRSWGLMERLGMTRYPDEDFDHPGVPDASPLKRHILYRIARPSPYGPA